MDTKLIETDNNNTQNKKQPTITNDIIQMSGMQSSHADQMEAHITQSPISNVDIKSNQQNNDINIDCLSPDYDEKLHYESKDIDNDILIDKKYIIKHLSICLGFLLHENSPLWKGKKKHHSTIELLSKRLKKKRKSQLTFEDRCSIFRSHYVLGTCTQEEKHYTETPTLQFNNSPLFHAVFQELRLEEKINSDREYSNAENIFQHIMSNLNINKCKQTYWNELIEYWDSWQNNDNIAKNEIFDWDKYANDIENVSKTVDQLIDSLKLFNTSNEKPVERNMKKMEDIKTINNREDMERWLDNYKKNEHGVTYAPKSKMVDNPFMKYESEYWNDEDIKRTNNIHNLPFKLWDWKHVVFWIQKQHKFKNFAVVFYQWKINGEELLAMNEKQIISLTKCCRISPRFSSKIVKDLIIEIKKMMITTAITYQYGLYYRVIKEHLDDILMENSIKISDLLNYLHPKKEQGAKALWKLNTFYFSKIDNILAILIAPKECQKLLREWYPTFIFDVYNENQDKIMLNQEMQRKSISGRPLQLTLATTSTESNINFERPTTDVEKLQAEINAPALCCKNNCCRMCVRNFDLVYLKVMCLYICVLSFGCLIVWSWMSSRSRAEVDILMKWTAESIAARAVQYMEQEFLVPQIILNIAVGGLLSRDISINPNDFLNNSQFDQFFTQYKQYKVSTNNIYGLCMYETQNNSLICSSNNGDDVLIYTYDGICVRGWPYNPITKKRDKNNVVYNSCTANEEFIPQKRPWYLLSQQINFGDIAWTEPYQFAAINAIGITLVGKIKYNEIEVIFLSEFTTIELGSIFKSLGTVNAGVTYLITSYGSVLASSIGHIDLDSQLIVNCSDCSSSNTLLADSVALLRKQANDNGIMHYSNHTVLTTKNYTLALHSFKTTYLIGENFEYGTVAVVYGNEHLSVIETTELYSLSLYVIALTLILVIMCGMGYCLQLQRFKNQTGMQTHEVKSSLSKKIDCILDHRTIGFCSVCYILFVFLVTLLIWTKNVNVLLSDIEQDFFGEEYMIVEDKIVNIVAISDSIASIISERFNRGDMALKGVANIPKDLDVFFSNMMHSFKSPDGDFNAYMIYIGTPDGLFFGAGIEYDISDDHKSKYGNNTLRISIRDNSTNWIYERFAANPNTLERQNLSSPIKTSDWYDPRCRDWYKSALTYMVDGNLWNAFGNANNLINFYKYDKHPARFSVNCVDVIEYYQNIWNVTTDELNDIINNNLTHNIPVTTSLKPNKIYTETIKATNQTYPVVWSQYLFAEGPLGLTAAKPIINETSGELLAVIGIDFTLEGLSDYLNMTNNDLHDGHPWFTWIFTGDNAYDMVASSDHQITLSAADVEGCIQAAGTSADGFVQYNATEHPNTIIRIISQEIVQFYPGHDDLPINTTTYPEQIALPTVLPDALSGRFLTYPYSSSSEGVSLNWILTKSIDVRHFQQKQKDDAKIIAFILVGLVFIVFLIQRNFSGSVIKPYAQKYNEIYDKSVSSIPDQIAAEFNQPTIETDNVQLLAEMIDIVEGLSADMWDVFVKSFRDRIGEYPLSTSIVCDFLIKQSNKYILAAINNDELNLTLCGLQRSEDAENKWFWFRLLKFTNSYFWNTIIITVIFCHLLLSIYLPETPDKLEQFGFEGTEIQLLLVATSSLIASAIEIIDVILHGISRYILFGKIDHDNLISLMKLKYGFTHNYIEQIKNKSILWLTFFGTNNYKLFLIHITLVLL
eukprot:420703_1